MKQKASNKAWYVADFETTGQNEYATTGRTRVWLYSIANSDGGIEEDGDTIDKFMEWCSNHHGSLIYFHNLRFDGTFIMSWLLEQGFPYEENLLSHSKRGFNALIGEMGEYYQIKINFAPNRQVVIYDSLKIIPLAVRDIAKAFDLPIEKGIIDYDDYKITEETLSYVHKDVQIVAMALKYFRDKGYTRMTIGSNSYHSFKDSCPIFPLLFPRLDKDYIEEWRNAYRGGRSQVNPKFAGRVLKNVKRFDLNSMYPSIMAYKLLPYGKPIKCDKPGKYKFELYQVAIHFKLKEGHLPTLLKNGSIFNKSGDTYYTDSDGVIDIYISSIDLELMYRHYDIGYISYKQIWGFKCVAGIFESWVKTMYENKSKFTGGLRLLYKLLLNSLYGKFGSKAVGYNKIPFIDEDGSISFKNSEEHEMSLYYMPMAIAITSWAHKIIDDAIMQVGYDNFVYCDTDSVHTFADMPAEMVDNKELGKFKLEGVEEISKYVRQKTYIYKQDNEWEITCSGMPLGVKEYIVNKYDDKVIDVFDVGLHVDETSEGIKANQLKLMPKRVPGGVILKPVPFSLN